MGGITNASAIICCLPVSFPLLLSFHSLLLSSPGCFFSFATKQIKSSNECKQKKKTVFKQSGLCLGVIRFGVFLSNVIHTVDKHTKTHTHTYIHKERQYCSNSTKHSLLRDKCNELLLLSIAVCLCVVQALMWAVGLESSKEWCYSILGS